jgi:hypothetical protein
MIRKEIRIGNIPCSVTITIQTLDAQKTVRDTAAYDTAVFLEAKAAGEDDTVLSLRFSLPVAAGDIGRGIRLSMTAAVENMTGRVCVPSLQYGPEEGPEAAEYREDRLPSPFVLVYHQSDGTAFGFSKDSVSLFCRRPHRRKGATKYLHETDISSLGYTKKGMFLFHWPYRETEGSVSLDRNGSAPEAFYPMNGAQRTFSFVFTLSSKKAASYSEAIFREYTRSFECTPSPCGGNLSAEDAVTYKIRSLAETYRTFEEGRGAGFFFHFDPTKGYGSLPSGFGSSFRTIPETSYSHVLEYGFTGRQLNAAYLLAKADPARWLERSEVVIDFFVDRCTVASGWVYSLYDISAQKPVFSFGDPNAPRLHYVWNTDKKGNYLRTMVEPIFDLLRCYRLFAQYGTEKARWKACILAFAAFLVRVQDTDGSWYRGYGPDGLPATVDKSQPDRSAEKSGTPIPLPFLCALCELLETDGEYTRALRTSIGKGAEHLLRSSVRSECFRGGTMDNPNVVDKEAAQYTMAALVACYRLTKRKDYLEGARCAAYQFLSWIYTWNAPNLEGAFTDRCTFRTRGMGGINSIWGGGVVDIYALFHTAELVYLGRELDEPIFLKAADEIVRASAQCISYPGCTFGFAGIGMQPEGWGICPEGCDDDLIEKGDVWGSLGWIYSATIDGITRYEKFCKNLAADERRKK